MPIPVAACREAGKACGVEPVAQAHAADVLLEHVSRGVECPLEQIGLVLGCCDTGEGTHFRIADFALAEGRPDQRQLAQGDGDALVLPCRTETEVAVGAEPLDAGARPVVLPAAHGLEAGDIIEHAGSVAVDAAGVAAESVTEFANGGRVVGGWWSFRHASTLIQNCS